MIYAINNSIMTCKNTTNNSIKECDKADSELLSFSKYEEGLI